MAARPGLPTRLWLDGCFDGFHFAHANAVRQALTLVPGPVSITVGVHSDKEILRNKGPTLFDERERYDLIRGCRWVDAVVEDVPYVTNIQTIDAHGIDFVVHGDDVVLDADGNDCYAFAKAAGRYLECKRTDGISTTSLIERVLHADAPHAPAAPLAALLRAFAASTVPEVALADASAGQTLPSSGGARALISASWDVFGSAHVALLERAHRALPPGASLAVGVWSDDDVYKTTGECPLLAMLERALAVAQCRHVDAVILNAPRAIARSTADELEVQIVVGLASDVEQVEGIQVIVIDGVELQTVPQLRKRIEERLELYEDRQRRKGA